MAQQGWHNDHSSGSGVGSILLLLFLMALAAAGGWVLGNDELLGRAGARGENPSASAAPASPVQPAAVPTFPASDAVVVAAPTPTPSLPAIREYESVTPDTAPIPTATARPRAYTYSLRQATPLPPTPTPIPPTATPLPTPTPTPSGEDRLTQLRQYALGLINNDRADGTVCRPLFLARMMRRSFTHKTCWSTIILATGGQMVVSRIWSTLNTEEPVTQLRTRLPAGLRTNNGMQVAATTSWCVASFPLLRWQ